MLFCPLYLSTLSVSIAQLLEASWEDPHRGKAQEYVQHLKDLRLPNTKAEALPTLPKAKGRAHGEDRKAGIAFSAWTCLLCCSTGSQQGPAPEPGDNDLIRHFQLL